MWPVKQFKQLMGYDDDRSDQRTSKKKESLEDFYARLDREQALRDAERKMKMREEQRKLDEESMLREERRRIEEESRRRTEKFEETERKRAEEERFRRSKEQLENMLRIQRQETSRLLEEQRLRTVRELQQEKEEKEYQERRMRLNDEKQERERQEQEKEVERRDQAARVYSMQQLQLSKQAATSSLSSSVAAAAAESASSTERMIQQLAAENEAQRQLTERTRQLHQVLEQESVEKAKATSEFIKGLDDSMHEKLMEMEMIKKLQLEERQNREIQREESRLQFEAEWKMRRNKDDEEQREKNKMNWESTDKIRKEAAIKASRNEEEMMRLRQNHRARMEELLVEERKRMDEINRLKQQKEEERRLNWNRMMQGFAKMMRIRYAGIINREMEKKWDDRFNQLRRSFNPVRESFSELECFPFRKSDVATSLIQFEAHLYALGMSLTTLDEIMSSEKRQVQTWKQHQPDAHFLADVESALNAILSNIGRVRREMEVIADGIEINREKAPELDRIFELRTLQERMTTLSDAVESIPTVYELNRKYTNRA